MADKTVLFGEDISFAAKEAYKRLRSNVLFSFVDGKPNHIIGITSSAPSDGKSLTALNLAFSFYELGKKVLLIDADMRRPSIAGKLEIAQIPGLSDLLVNPETCGKTIIRCRENGDGSVLDVMPAGSIPPNPSELLNSGRMKNLLEKLTGNYDYILIDLPPVGAVVDAQAVSTLTDGMILVIREGHCDSQVLNDCIAQLKIANTRILGFVLNGASEGARKNYKYYNR